VDDAVRIVRVQPVETPSQNRASDIARDLDGFSVRENRQVLMDVKDGAFGLIAMDAVDRFSGRHFATRGGRKSEGENAYGDGEQRRSQAEKSAQEHTPETSWPCGFGE
jgi:hypothetical protein